MVHTQNSPTPDAEVRRTLRLLYFGWNIIGTVILGMIATSPKIDLTEFEKIQIFGICYLILTFLSYLLGIEFRIMFPGFMDINIRIKAKITFKTYALALVAQSIPLWGNSMFNGTWQTYFIIAGGLLLLWLSAKSIKINIPKQKTTEN